MSLLSALPRLSGRRPSASHDGVESLSVFGSIPAGRRAEASAGALGSLQQEPVRNSQHRSSATTHSRLTQVQGGQVEKWEDCGGTDRRLWLSLTTLVGILED